MDKSSTPLALTDPGSKNETYQYDIQGDLGVLSDTPNRLQTDPALLLTNDLGVLSEH